MAMRNPARLETAACARASEFSTRNSPSAINGSRTQEGRKPSRTRARDRAAAKDLSSKNCPPAPLISTGSASAALFDAQLSTTDGYRIERPNRGCRHTSMPIQCPVVRTSEVPSIQLRSLVTMSTKGNNETPLYRAPQIQGGRHTSSITLAWSAIYGKHVRLTTRNGQAYSNRPSHAES